MMSDDSHENLELGLGHNRPPTVNVVLPLAVDRPYSYQIPEGMKLERGDVVEVPLGPRTYLGIVWSFDEADVPFEKLKCILNKVDAAGLPEPALKFAGWVANYTLSSIGMIGRSLIRSQQALLDAPSLTAYRYVGSPPERMTAARSRVLDIAQDGLAWQKKHLAEAAEVGIGVVNGLISGGILQPVHLAAPGPVDPPDPEYDPADLSEPQSVALQQLSSQGDGFFVSLLEGVTGSGKTEVYFERLAQILSSGRQGLILIPEISLTNAFLARFRQRFGAEPAAWHSDLTPKQRERIWRGVHRGSIRCVVGARSSLFLPFADLGLIIVDEEHDQAYKQEDRTSYHGRDMAIVLASLHNAPVILASATPSVESWVNAHEGKYTHVKLASRFGLGALPDISTVDLRINKPQQGKWIAPDVINAVRQTVESEHQALLFLNRRGYAPLTLCNSCGHRFQCNNCSAWLVDHRFRKVLMCHHCGHEERRPEICPKCEKEGSLVAVGPGVERIAEEVREAFPEARICILSSDMMGGWGALRRQFDAIVNHEVDIIIGTQLISKGHNFPKLMLSAVLDADIGLANGDLRGSERAWQLLQQVIGRAGRFAAGAKGIIQTHMPEHAVLKALKTGDADMFYAAEAEQRELVGMPPFGRLVSIIISGKDQREVQYLARDLARAAPKEDGIEVLGPADPIFTQLRGRFRQRLLVQSEKNLNLQAYVRGWLANGPKLRGNLQIQVDVDPQSFF